MKEFSKRDFIKMGLASAGLFFYNSLRARTPYANLILSKTGIMDDKPWKWSKEVFYYTKNNDSVTCEVCPHNCVIKEGKGGFCNNKVNHEGTLYSLAYANPCSLSIDPIEKKPLLHFLPQSHALSLAVAGCNFRCLNCQNWSISQVGPLETRNYELWPKQVVPYAKKNNCKSIAFTYSEPVVFYEYMFDVAKDAKENKLDTVLVSNGYINEKPLRALAPYMSAANIDLKSFDKDVHFKLTQGKLSNVLNTLKVLKEENVWVEITNLIIPQWSDDMDIIKRMCAWLKENELHHFPLHFSRFSPIHKLAHLPSTPVSLLEKAHSIAKEEGILYAYIGNVPGHKYENTFCPECNTLLIERRGYTILSNKMKNGKCNSCGAVIHGVWND